VVSEVRELTPVRPLIAGTTQALVSSVPFQVVVRTTAKTAHEALLSKGAENVFLSLPDVGALVRSVLQTLNPEAAAKIPRNLSPRIAELGQSKVYLGVRRAIAFLQTLVKIELIAMILGPLLLIGAIVVARDRRRGVIDAAVALLIAAAVVFAVFPLGRLIALVAIPGVLERHAAVGLWVTWFSGLRVWAATLAGIGLVLLAAGMSLLEAFELRTAGKALWNRLTALPEKRGGQLASALGLLVAGAMVVVWPTTALQTVAVVVGLLLAYAGLRELFGIILASVPAEAEAVAARGGRISVRLAVVGGVAVALIGALVFALRPTHKVIPVSAVTECNGATELCDRRVNEVVFAGAHNAMSNEDVPRWMFPHHERGIPRMLRDGVRAFAFDMHYGRPMGDGTVVKTAMDLETVSAEKIASAIGVEGVEIALRIRDRFVGGDSGSAAPYFCHGYCELGAYPVVPTLEAMRDFLVENPGEVLVLVIEDYISPEDVVKVFEQSGLAKYVYQGPLGPPWPTLRELINGGGRVMVFVETGKTAAPWVHPAFETIQETKYTFHKPEDFSCVPNRGGTGGTLFQINHWIETTPAPQPKNAELVNAHDALLKRAEDGRKERGMLPNVLLVDFYRTGDLFGVVRELNGLPAPAADTTVRR
jgi:hypothetical protein